MDVKLEGLIEKIKKDGIEEAGRQSERIIKEAEEKAAAIVKKANQEAREIKEQNEREVEKLQKSSQESLRQAARNLIISVREKLTEIFNGILKKELGKGLGPELLAEVLKIMAEKWVSEKDEGLEVLLSEKDKKGVEKFLLVKLKEETKEKLEIKISPSLSKGFQVKAEGEDAYYDFSDEGIAEALAVFLNPFLTSLILGKNKKDG